MKIGSDMDGVMVGRDGVVETAQGLQRVAKAVVDFGLLRPEAHGGTVRGDGIVEAAQCRQRASQTRVIMRGRVIDPDRATDQFNSGFVSSGL